MISIIVPVYKTEQYLEKCVQSLLNQTYRDFELILIDDGSPDKCGAMCDELSDVDSRIRVLHKRNGGLSDARNAGLEIAKGEYITFVDSDDYVAPELLETLMDGIREGTQVSACNFFTVRDGVAKPWRNPKGGFIQLSSLEAVEDMLYAHSIDTSVWGKLFHRSCFAQIRFPVGRVYEEVATTYRLMLTQRRVSITMRPLYYYVKRAGSIVTAGYSSRDMDMMDHSKAILAFAQREQPELLPAACRRIVYACFYLLKTMGMAYRRYPDEVAELMRAFRQYRGPVFRDRKVSRRDRAAIILLSLGVAPFQWVWYAYSATTGRHGNA